MRPRFLVVEGADGVGKSTFIQTLHHALASKRVQSVSFQNPGTTELGKVLRNILLNSVQDPKWVNLSGQAEIALFLAGNAQLGHEVVGPALEQGQWVIMDRWNWSTMVYQVLMAERCELELLPFVQKMTGGVIPDMCFWLDVDLGVAKSRLGQNRVDRYESKGDGYLGRLIESYRDSAATVKSWYPVRRIDATLPPMDMIQEALGVLQRWLNG